MNPRGKVYLEIGAGESAAIHLMPKMRRGDKYISVDVRPLASSNWARVKKTGVKNLPLLSDMFLLPLRDNSVDHVVSRNVISDRGFPHVYNYKRFPGLSFRQALEKLETELHRVTRPGASITFHEQYTPSVLDELLDDGKSRRMYVKEVFGHRWIVKHGRFSNLPSEFDVQVIKLFKK